MQVSASAMLTMAFCALMGVVIPVALFLWGRKRLGASAVPFFVGCGAFVLFALVLESIMHNLVLRSAIGPTVQNNVWLYALYGGLAAGVFEETGRLVAMKWLKKKHNSPRTALMYGAGHGGVEVLLVLAVTMVQNIVLANMLNAGQMEQMLAMLPEETQTAMMATLQTLAATPAPTYLLSIVERLIAVVLHISLSVLVWEAAVKPGKLGMYFLAIALHALADGVLVIFAGLGMPTLAVEGCLAVMTALIAVYAGKVYRRL